MKRWVVCLLFVLIVLLSMVLPVAAVMNPINATVSSSAVKQGEKLFINGTASGPPSSVAIWILGQNFAFKQTVAVNVNGSFSYETDAGYNHEYEQWSILCCRPAPDDERFI